MEKKLKIALLILIMILIIVVGFGGIYVKKIFSYKNILPDYELGSKLEGTRISTLKVGDHTHEIIYDSEGNIVDKIPEGEDEKNYTKEQVPENSEESKTTNNYKKVKEIITKRLKSLAISNYEVRFNKDNGKIVVELPETDNTDTILSNLLLSGEFKIIDTQNKTVLMTNDDIETADVLYNSDTSGITVYLDIKFNKEGKSKLRQISNEYTEEEETENKKTITLDINGEEILTTHFDSEITNGELPITIGMASTDSDTISEYVSEAQYYSATLSNGKMPLEYEIETSEYVQSEYANFKVVYVLLGIMTLLLLLSIVYIIVKYKKYGLLSSIIYVATVAMLIIIIRCTRTEITLDTIVISITLIFLNTYINCKILKGLSVKDSADDRKAKIRNIYMKLIDLLIVILIASVVFTYNRLSAISSVGMLLFWGICVIALMNFAFTRTIFIEEAKNR